MRHRLLWATTLLVLSLLAGGLQAAPSQPPRPRGEGPLSARLATLAAAPALLADRAALTDALSLQAEGPGSLLASGAGELLIYIQTGSAAEDALAALTAAGARVTHVSARYGVVTAYVRPDELPAVGRVPNVRAMVEALAPSTAGLGARAAAVGPAQANCAGAFTSEGDAQLRANLARATYGVDGAGVTVGLLSDSYDRDEQSQVRAADDIARGDLPGAGNPCGRTEPVRVIEEASFGGSDEGRAMAQIVHDLAPGAPIAFASAFNGLFAFADNIRRLRREAGAAIIVDDVSYFEEPQFQDGPVSVAISEVTGDGALYFTAAGNAHSLDLAGRPIGSYEAAAYRPAPCPTLTVGGQPIQPVGIDCHDFDPGAGTDPTLGVTLGGLASLAAQLHWSEPWFGVRTDLDLYLVDATGELVGAGATSNTFTPFEAAFADLAPNVSIVVARFGGEADQLRLKLLLDGHIGLEYAGGASGDILGPTVGDHSMAADAISVAAVPYFNGNLPEEFSSRGPAAVYWEPTLSIVSARPLTQPEPRNKPDLAATNGGLNSFFPRGTTCAPGQPFSICRFFGTSAAAPHAAAVAALMRERAAARGALLNQQQARELLTTTAAPMGDTPQARGAGLVDAFAAVGAVGALDAQVYLPMLQR